MVYIYYLPLLDFYKKEKCVRKTKANVFRELTTRESELKGRTGERA